MSRALEAGFGYPATKGPNEYPSRTLQTCNATCVKSAVLFTAQVFTQFEWPLEKGLKERISAEGGSPKVTVMAAATSP